MILNYQEPLSIYLQMHELITACFLRNVLLIQTNYTRQSFFSSSVVSVKKGRSVKSTGLMFTAEIVPFARQVFNRNTT